ncbi:RNA-binding, RBD [Glarea lozoyensis ATCC 20868]|uniref:RNA-binding, RBD n=2 Tax=Glarea lozoyensis TaxID=101852 RepID=S3DCX7_GLAL2|nr:RNA-binding, RBD [Glarea lozoyensis ATCC 20868]EHL02188.1 hypothetical protein M7I_1782 [Glarea lozoyensis 74030]EPE24548.1 RNA-binding, RBD [Glarea lozoyensis ATCC 20868]
MAPYPELLWVFDALGINPSTAPPGFEDGWISFNGLKPTEFIPAIPPQYRREFLDKRVIYVTGIPSDVAPPAMRTFFAQFGNVDKCIVVVDLKSEVSFRWVVMGSQDESKRVLKGAHGVAFREWEGGERRVFVLRCCEAVGPDGHVRIDGKGGVGKRISEDEGRGLLGDDENQEDNTHRHPSPVIARVKQPTQPQDNAESQEADVSSNREGSDRSEEQYEEGYDPDYWEVDAQEESTKKDSEDPDLPTVVTTPPEGFVTQASSWANIAGTANPSHQVINIALASRGPGGPRLKPVGRIPSISAPRGGESHVQTIRVVHLLGIPNNLNLQDISNAVKEGALRAIRFGIDAENGSRWAGIVFQHASEAETFWQVLSRERSEGKPERFKCIVEAVRGDPFQQDDILRAMGPPTFASRRLTIVKSRFFFMFGEKNLRALCEKLVGKENIQLIWLYNGGNATIVFADVESAMIVKEKLDDMAAGRGLASGQSASTWEGLQTTFSKDPCVAPLELKTAMQ